MADWTDGCFNGLRYAEGLGSGGPGTREWLGANNASVVDQPNNKTLIVAIAMDTDDMCSLTDDLVLSWQDDTDASGYTDLASTGELKWDGSSDLTNGNAVTSAEDTGAENCSTMGVSRVDGIERAGANLVAASGLGSKVVINYDWQVNIAGAQAGHTYSFRIRTATGGGGDLIATSTATLGVVAAGKIDLVTRNEDRSAVEGSITVSAFLSDGGSPPAPTGSRKFKGVSNGSGVLSVTGLVSGEDYILIGGAASAIRSDATPEVTAVDA